jgi:biopolymer transport protein ExbD
VFEVYDQEQLRDALVPLKHDHPSERTLILSADASVPFEAIIDVIDATRSYHDGELTYPLFDAVQFRPDDA